MGDRRRRGGHGGVGKGHGGGHGRGGGRRAAGDLLDMASNGEIEQTIVVTGLGASDNRATDDDVFYLFLQKQKIGAELHIYLP